jgi:3-isopropylmalate/(R)-2-methylmalate dehydratase small subunit
MQRFVRLEASALPIAQSNVDTDQIFPARFLQKPRGDGLGHCLFHDLRFNLDGSEKPDFVLNKPQFRDARIIVGNENFGCGSSRENAVWALVDYGFKVALAPSFGDIFAGNCLKNGVLPIRLPRDVVSALLARLIQTPAQKMIQVDLESQTVTLPDGVSQSFEIEPFAKHCVMNGLDELDYTLTRLDEISAFESRYNAEN